MECNADGTGIHGPSTCPVVVALASLGLILGACLACWYAYVIVCKSHADSEVESPRRPTGDPQMPSDVATETAAPGVASETTALLALERGDALPGYGAAQQATPSEQQATPSEQLEAVALLEERETQLHKAQRDWVEAHAKTQAMGLGARELRVMLLKRKLVAFHTTRLRHERRQRSRETTGGLQHAAALDQSVEAAAAPPAASESDVTVQDISGTKHVLRMIDTGATTVSELKRELQQRSGIPPDAQRLLLNQQTLEDETKCLRAYGVQPGCTISLTLQDETACVARRDARLEKRVRAADGRDPPGLSDEHMGLLSSTMESGSRLEVEPEPEPESEPHLSVGQEDKFAIAAELEALDEQLDLLSKKFVNDQRSLFIRLSEVHGDDYGLLDTWAPQGSAADLGDLADVTSEALHM